MGTRLECVENEAASQVARGINRMGSHDRRSDRIRNQANLPRVALKRLTYASDHSRERLIGEGVKDVHDRGVIGEREGNGVSVDHFTALALSSEIATRLRGERRNELDANNPAKRPPCREDKKTASSASVVEKYVVGRDLDCVQRPPRKLPGRCDVGVHGARREPEGVRSDETARSDSMREVLPRFAAVRTQTLPRPSVTRAHVDEFAGAEDRKRHRRNALRGNRTPLSRIRACRAVVSLDPDESGRDGSRVTHVAGETGDALDVAGDLTVWQSLFVHDDRAEETFTGPRTEEHIGGTQCRQHAVTGDVHDEQLASQPARKECAQKAELHPTGDGSD
jgi:hypothetical protein